MRLEVNDKIAQLPPDASIDIKIHNPAFHKLGTYSMPFNLVRHLNRATMQYAEDEDKLTETTQLFKLYLGNELFMEGEMGVNDTVKGYKCYLKSGKSSIARILKESFLDGEINGQSWGENPDGLTGLNNSVNGAYPDYLMVAPPLKLDDFICNEWDLDNQQLVDLISNGLEYLNLSMLVAEGRINPMVYVKHVVNQIFKATSVLVNANDLSLFNDFNRLCVFSPKKGLSNSDALTKVANFLPHIPATDFLNIMRERFNLVAFFSPFGREVDFISFEKAFTSPIVDWTDKFIRNEKRPDKVDGAIFLANDGDDEDVITYEELDANNDLNVVADYATMVADAESDYNNYVKDDKYYKLDDSNRVFVARDTNIKGDLTNDYHIGDSILGAIYQLVVGPWPNVTHNFTVSFGAGAEEWFMRWRFPEGLSGRVERSIYIRRLGLYVASGTSVNVRMVVYVQNTETTTTKTILEKTVTITNTDPYASPFNTRRGVELVLNESPELGEDTDWNMIQVSFYAGASTAGSIGVRIGKQTDGQGVDLHAFAAVDGYDRRIIELGRIASYPKGSGSDLTEYSPKNKILLNEPVRMGDYLFQMPVSESSPKIGNKECEFTFYRGIITDEIDAANSAPFANFDDVDIYTDDYTSRLTNGATPDMTLRWQGANGTVNQFWQKTINWLQYRRRPVRKVFDLSKNDLQNIKMWHRIRVDNKLYLIDIISVKANANGELSESVVDMYLL